MKEDVNKWEAFILLKDNKKDEYVKFKEPNLKISMQT